MAAWTSGPRLPAQRSTPKLLECSGTSMPTASGTISMQYDAASGGNVPTHGGEALVALAPDLPSMLAGLPARSSATSCARYRSRRRCHPGW